MNAQEYAQAAYAGTPFSAPVETQPLDAQSGVPNAIAEAARENYRLQTLTPDAHAYELLRYAGYKPSQVLPGRPVHTKRGDRYAFDLPAPPSLIQSEQALRDAGFVIGAQGGTLWVKSDTDLQELNRCLVAIGAPQVPPDGVPVLVGKVEAMLEKARAAVPVRWKSFLERPSEILVFDTETTGLRDPKLCSIAICRTDGEPVFESLVMPDDPIDAGASRTHGHTKESLAAAGAPPYADIHEEVSAIVGSAKGMLAWNARFDVAALEGTALRAGLSLPPIRSHCVMRDYSIWFPGDRFRLLDAMQKAGLKGSQKHTAMDDCRTIVEVMRILTGYAPPVVMSARLPYPVSFNQMTVVRGNRDKSGPAVALSPEYKAYRDAVREALGDGYVRFGADDHLALSITLYPPDSGNMQDTSNGIKALEDALQKWEVYPDDKQIAEITVRRAQRVEGEGYADVQVRKL